MNNDLEDIKDNSSNIDLLSVYPIGSIYISYNSTNPSTLFGGTWEQIQGRFLLGVSSTYTVGSTGGNSSVTSGASSTSRTDGTAITVAQMPSHAHTIGYQKYGKPSGSTDWLVQASWSAAPYTSTVSSTGSGQAHDHSMAHTHTVNTMPPYITVYMWRRTA